MLDRIFSLFRKKQTPLGYWCAIRWSNEAIETGLGYSFLKKIVHLSNTNIVGVENYSEAKVKELQRKGVIVADMASSAGVAPKDTVFIPQTERVLGIIQLEENVN